MNRLAVFIVPCHAVVVFCSDIVVICSVYVVSLFTLGSPSFQGNGMLLPNPACAFRQIIWTGLT